MNAYVAFHHIFAIVAMNAGDYCSSSLLKLLNCKQNGSEASYCPIMSLLIVAFPCDLVALFKTAYDFLARRKFVAAISLKYCKTANTSRTAFRGYHWCLLQVSYSSIDHWLVSNQIILWLQATKISSCMALMETKFENISFMAFSAKKALDPFFIHTKIGSCFFDAERLCNHTLMMQNYKKLIH